jgi:hypothetical protein
MPRAAVVALLLAAAPALADTRTEQQKPIESLRSVRAGERGVRSLDGLWQFRRDADKPDAWKVVTLPACFQTHEGTDFHGVGWYRNDLGTVELPEGKRLLLHFDAVATVAEVWWNDTKLGTHVGGWTPIRFDVTELVRKAGPGAKHAVRLRVDEKVGHNTQGFLPIVQPHFGGMWQGAKLLTVGETYIDDLSLQTTADPATGVVTVRMPLGGSPLKEGAEPWVGMREFRRAVPNREKALERPERALSVENLKRDGGAVTFSFRVEGAKRWSPDDPVLYELDLGVPGDAVGTRVGFRTVETKGEQLLLNGKPLVVRGVLNWGYYPPRLDPGFAGPIPGEGAIPYVRRGFSEGTGAKKYEADFDFARRYGFNLIKCCLWVPPRCYLDLADEHGVLVWMEYPTWHPKLTKEFLPELRQEFREFFAFDRGHPSVILRSLTCETGPGAELPVVRELYDLCKAMVPGAVVEDDSSWIGWNRVHDFWDDHPYGNNHDWVATLARLKEHVAKHGAKPLLLGEAIAADTWTDPAPLLHQVKTTRPYWLPGFADANAAWAERMRRLTGVFDNRMYYSSTLFFDGLSCFRYGGLGTDTNNATPEQFLQESKQYALLMRKYQIEAFRREVPAGGYVVSVMRDFPLAGMGLIDYRGQPKWQEQDWAWHRDTMLLMKTEGDRRAFTANEAFAPEVSVAHAGQLPAGKVHWQLTGSWPTEPAAVSLTDTRAVTLKAPPVLKVYSPMRFELKASLEAGAVKAANEWPMWMVPPRDPDTLPPMIRHSSMPKDAFDELFPGAKAPPDNEPAAGIIVARRLDEKLLELLQAGDRVLLLPDGCKGSPPLRPHWFLRGGPLVAPHPSLRGTPRQMIVELQHFDLAGDVIPDVGYLDEIEPVVVLWDNHDIKEVKTHALVFEAKVGEGRLFVSALRHGGTNNPAGKWLLDRFALHLASNHHPKRALSPGACRLLREKLDERSIDLTAKVWRFKPDPKNEGVTGNWYKPNRQPDATWSDIRVGRHWEGQGFPSLDGLAWYRLGVDVPADWEGKSVYLTFEGVDDSYELYVNGELAGAGGDKAKKIDAFSVVKSHDISRWVKPGSPCVIAVRVDDWQGAGGIHRPVTLGTARRDAGAQILK